MILKSKSIAMTNEELLEYCQLSIELNDYVAFENNVFEMISQEQAQYLSEVFASDTLILLPEYEIKFFEWLRRVAPDVWKDLWESEMHLPYLVGMYFLPILVKRDGRGFPICDLHSQENYYFLPKFMTDEESKVIIETSKTRFTNNEELSTKELLALEISFDPIDIWHFAYKYKIDLNEAKAAVQELVDDNALVHLKESEHLSVFI